MNKIINREYFLLTIILILGFIVRLYKIDNPIADWHSWRQADTASVSRIYLDEGINVLFPRYYDVSRIQTGATNIEGLRMVEFPVYNVFHTLLIKNIPLPEQVCLTIRKVPRCYQLDPIVVWGRLISIFSALFTALFLYLIGKKFLGSWGGLLSAFIYLFIPYNIYFTRVILPEPMSVAFGVASIWFFLKYLDKEKFFYLITSGILFALSTLIKPFTFFYAVPLIYLAVDKYGFFGIFKKWKLLVFANIAINPFFIWRIWVNRFPVGIPHFEWAFNGDGIRFKPAFWYWIFGERIGKLILGIWGLVPFSFGVISSEKKYRFFHFFFLGMLAYVTVFATASVRHDYYQTFLIPSIALLVSHGIISVWNKNLTAKLLSVASIFLMFYIGAFQVKEFYKVNHPELIVAGAAADRIIPKDAKIIAPYNGDTAFLYQTKRYGWPVVDETFDEMVARGAQYFVAVNFADPDVAYVEKNYKVLEKTTQYIIADLTQKIK